MTPYQEKKIPPDIKKQIQELIHHNQFKEALEMLTQAEGYQSIASLLISRYTNIKQQERLQLSTMEENGVAYNKLTKDILDLLSSDLEELTIEEVSSPFAPLLPNNYVQRSDFFTIQAAIIEQAEKYYGMAGLPGSGKSILAAALARSKKVLIAFDGGVYWVGSNDQSIETFGNDTLISYQEQLYVQLQKEPIGRQHFSKWQEGLATLQHIAKSRLHNKKCLIIIDNLSNNNDLLKAIEIHENAVFLITTSDRSLLHAKGVQQGAIFNIKGLDKEEAIRLLSKWTERSEDKLPEAAREIIRRVDYLPLAIAMIGASLKGAIDQNAAWEDVLGAIKEGDLEDISHAVDQYPLGTLTRVFHFALSRLEEAERKRFYELGMFPQGWQFKLTDLIALWKDEKERKLRLFVQNLVNKALLQQTGSSSFTIHSLIRLHIRNETPDLLPIYQRVGPLLFPSMSLPALATIWQDVDALNAMINQVNVDEEIQHGWTALHLAAERGYLDIVHILLSARASVDKKITNGITALMLATKNGHSDVVAILLQGGADLDTQDAEGFTALHCAAQFGQAKIASLLLHHGATPDLPSHHQKSPLHIAAIYGHIQIVKELLQILPLHKHEKDSQSTPLRSAVYKGHVNVVRMLLDAGAEVNWSSPKDAATSLHVAAQLGYTDIVEMLLQANATVNTKMKEGYTPLHLAAQGGQIEIVKLLIAAGADVLATTHNRHTPLHSATQERHENRHREIVKVLIDKGSDVNAQNDKLFTPLHNAANILDTELARLLIDAGANVNLTQIDGYSALHISLIKRINTVLSVATYQASISITEEGSSMSASTTLEVESGIPFIKLLLDKGASVHSRTKDANYPLHFAAQYGDAESAELLLSAGASPNVMNEEGKTPLDLAFMASKNVYSQLYTNRNYTGVIALLKQRLQS